MFYHHTKVALCSILAWAVSSQEIFSWLKIPQHQSAQWQWQTFQNIPNIDEDDSREIQQDGVHKSRYSLSYSLDSKRNVQMEIHGSNKNPQVVIISSGGWGFHELNQLWKLDFKGANKLKSNCNFAKSTVKDDDSTSWIDEQTVYAYTMPNAHTLYIVASSGGGTVETSVFNYGVNRQYIITPHKQQLSVWIQQYGWNTNAKGVQIKKCTLE